MSRKKCIVRSENGTLDRPRGGCGESDPNRRPSQMRLWLITPHPTGPAWRLSGATQYRAMATTIPSMVTMSGAPDPGAGQRHPKPRAPAYTLLYDVMRG